MYNLRDIYAGKYDDEFLKRLETEGDFVIPPEEVELPPEASFFEESDKRIRVTKAHRDKGFWDFGPSDSDSFTAYWDEEVPNEASCGRIFEHTLGKNESERFDRAIAKHAIIDKRHKEELAQMNTLQAQFDKAYAEVQKVRETELYKRLVPYLDEHPLLWVFNKIDVPDDDPVWIVKEWKELGIEWTPRIWLTPKFMWDPKKRKQFAEFLVYRYAPKLKKTNSPGWFSKQLWELIHKNN